jgi:hypothetical protein
MKIQFKALLTPITSAAAITLFANCTVENEEDGSLPSIDVDIEADGGKLPKYDVDAPDVDIETKKVEVEVPTLDFDSAEEDEKEDGTD